MFKFLLFFVFIHQAVFAKTLVVILGETRAYELTYENIKQNLIDPLQADLALCIGVKENYNYDNPFYQNAKYRFLYNETDDYGPAFDYAYETMLSRNPPNENYLPWREFLKIKDQFLGGIKDPHHQHSGSGGILLFYRWLLLEKILENDLLDEYDFFIITRSDYIFVLPHPNIEVFSPDHLYIPDGENWGGVTDRHAVLPKQFVISYLNILNNMLYRGKEYYEKMRYHQHWNIEKMIQFHLEQNGALSSVKLFPYVMYTVRAANGPTRWSVGNYSKKHGYFIKYDSEYASAQQNEQEFAKAGCNLDTFYLSRIKNFNPTPPQSPPPKKKCYSKKRCSRRRK